MRRALACFITLTLFASIEAAGPPEVITIEGGQIQGTLTDGVRSFRGIPYAAPPTGDNRWTPPRPVVQWDGVRDGAKFGPECPQTQYPEGSVYIRPMRPLSEDCLTLNVWTTAKANDRRPVLVWIHGGALTRGSSTSDVRDGNALARKGIVVVSINYRLGALGYLAHPDLSKESGRRASGNYGVLDQIAALTWVQRNIAVFGGDQHKVTIGGESAGSWSVNTLVASPLTARLFVRAIGESGGRFTGTPRLKEDRPGLISAENVGVAFARTVGASSVADLRALPVEKLLDVRGFRTQENVDGWVLPADIKTVFAENRQNQVSVLVGQNANEMTSLGGTSQQPASDEEYRQRVQRQYGELAPEFDAAYRVTGLESGRDALLAAGRDQTFSYHMREWARAASRGKTKAYLYLFSHVPPSPRARELKAFHASELPYVFGALTAGDPREAGFAWTDVDRQLSDQMSSYWVNFITTGDPNGKKLPKWEPYTVQDEAYLDFGDAIAAGRHLFKAELDFQEKALNPRR